MGNDHKSNFHSAKIHSVSLSPLLQAIYKACFFFYFMKAVAENLYQSGDFSS